MLVYARFQKLDRSDFEDQPPPSNPCLLGVLLVAVGGGLLLVLLFCPLGVLMLSQLGSSGLEQELLFTNNSSAVAQIHWPPVRFSQWTYFNPKFPQADVIVFSSEQRASLGMVDHDSMMVELLPPAIALLAYTCFFFRALNLGFGNNWWKVEQQRKLTWSIGAVAVCSCILTILTLIPTLKLLHNSPLCGPHYIELPFERYKGSNNNTNYEFYGTTTILHEDIPAHCVLGKDFYWQLGLGAANLVFLVIWFFQQRSYNQKKHLLAITEANLSYDPREDDDCELQEMQAAGIITTATASSSDSDNHEDDSHVDDRSLQRIT